MPTIKEVIKSFENRKTQHNKKSMNLYPEFVECVNGLFDYEAGDLITVVAEPYFFSTNFELTVLFSKLKENLKIAIFSVNQTSITTLENIIKSFADEDGFETDEDIWDLRATELFKTYVGKKILKFLEEKHLELFDDELTCEKISKIVRNHNYDFVIVKNDSFNVGILKNLKEVAKLTNTTILFVTKMNCFQSKTFNFKTLVSPDIFTLSDKVLILEHNGHYNSKQCGLIQAINSSGKQIEEAAFICSSRVGAYGLIKPFLQDDNINTTNHRSKLLCEYWPFLSEDFDGFDENLKDYFIQAEQEMILFSRTHPELNLDYAKISKEIKPLFDELQQMSRVKVFKAFEDSCNDKTPLKKFLFFLESSIYKFYEGYSPKELKEKFLNYIEEK